MTTSLKLLSSLALATALSLTSYSSGAAEPEADGFTKTVKMWDLDLAKSDDVQALYQRIQEAAVDVCQAEVARHRRSTRQRAPSQWSARCVRDAVDAAVRDAGNRRLATLHGAPRDASNLL